jgi:hypothetical protein
MKTAREPQWRSAWDIWLKKFLMSPCTREVCKIWVLTSLRCLFRPSRKTQFSKPSRSWVKLAQQSRSFQRLELGSMQLAFSNPESSLRKFRRSQTNFLNWPQSSTSWSLCQRLITGRLNQ